MPISVVALTLLVASTPAQATFHAVSISEVYPGSAAAPESSFVELQMYEGGQHFVSSWGSFAGLTPPGTRPPADSPS